MKRTANLQTCCSAVWRLCTNVPVLLPLILVVFIHVLQHWMKRNSDKDMVYVWNCNLMWNSVEDMHTPPNRTSLKHLHHCLERVRDIRECSFWCCGHITVLLSIHEPLPQWRHNGLMVSALDFQSEGWWVESGLCHHVVCLGRNLCSTLSLFTQVYIYLINQVRGLYWENISPRSWQYGPRCARSVHKRLRADILPVRSRASLVNKRFITRLKTIVQNILFRKEKMRAKRKAKNDLILTESL